MPGAPSRGVEGDDGHEDKDGTAGAEVEGCPLKRSWNWA
jgi:hypothetical protein